MTSIQDIIEIMEAVVAVHPQEAALDERHDMFYGNNHPRDIVGHIMRGLGWKAKHFRLPVDGLDEEIRVASIESCEPGEYNLHPDAFALLMEVEKWNDQGVRWDSILELIKETYGVQ